MKSDNLPAVHESTNHLGGMSVDGISMLQSENEPSSSGPKLNDILFILFRHKWKILLCAALGIVGAGGIYFLLPPIYESRAKLIVRYVVDRSAVDNLDASVKTPGVQDENLINSEAEILTSQDVAMQVADVVGPELLVKPSKGKEITPEAAREILKSLEVTALKGSNIISIAYKNSDPLLAKQVLEQLVKFYFDKHLEVHRSVGAFDLVTRQIEQLRGELSQTEKELSELKAKAGITSLAEDTSALATEMTKTQQDLNTAEAEIASQEARLHEIEKWNSGEQAKQSANETKQQDNAIRQPSSSVTDEYRSMVSRVAQLRQAETELLSKYTEQNRIVRVKQTQIDELEKQRRDLERKYPGLVATLPTSTSAEGARPDFVTERARLVAAQAQAATLKSRLSGLQERSKVYSELVPRIGQLERTKEVQEANYKYLEASLQKARIDETLDPSRMPNIGIVEKPTTAEKTIRDVKKIVMGLSVGGLGVGIAIALLIELVLDRTIKRPQELESRLRIPLLLSIPNFAARGGQSRLRLHDAGEDLNGDTRQDLDPSEETGALLRPFCEAIRDRLGLFFELNRMTHKPKLVAVTGLSKNAGASTLATGLAASLSESGEGKVLLVDKPITSKKFYDLLLEFKQSDLNYVVFDMPSLGNTSATVPLAGFMDKVLLVVEAEKSNRDAVKRAYTQLSAKTDVSVIFNKSRSYGPKWLEGEV
jgi:succinoglycan biosynthesis transport protein ExoP